MTTEQTVKDHFKEAIESLRKTVDFGMRVSLKLRGKPATDQSVLASIVHTKMCINGTSAERLLQGGLTDHSVIVGICRMIMEASVLYQYLMENISPDEWNCRLLCLKLHDTVNRIKPAFPGSRTDLCNARADSDIGISTLFWIERGGDGGPGG